jgi:hypothetical protein
LHFCNKNTIKSGGFATNIQELTAVRINILRNNREQKTITYSYIRRCIKLNESQLKTLKGGNDNCKILNILG